MTGMDPLDHRCAAPENHLSSRHPHHSRLFPALTLAIGLGWAGLSASPALSSDRDFTHEYAKDGRDLAYTRQVENVDPNRIVIRFHPDSGARVRSGSVVSVLGTDLGSTNEILAAQSGQLSPRFQRSEDDLDQDRILGEARTGRALPDLNLFAMWTLPSLDSDVASIDRLRALLEDLNADPMIAEAWALPNASPPAFQVLPLSTSYPQGPGTGNTSSTFAGQAQSAETADSWTGSSEAGGRRGGTPDFSSQQGYLYSPPQGINAESAWAHPGGMGQGIDVIDIEWGWLFTHEDFKEAFVVLGDASADDHGTGVVGIFSGQHNGYGVDGISPEAGFGAASLNNLSIPDAINQAAAELDPGDIFLMEVQCSGPVNWMPCEWWGDVYAAIEVATALGVVCVEAGGNGTIDLDDPLYGDLFDRRVRDSGAIMVGAGTPSGLNAEWFSNFGDRVDLQGWGSSIVSTCCGDLQGGDPNVHYTAGFSGTSGASPMVVGAVASLQGQALAEFGTTISSDLAEEILSATGTPWTGDRQVGERPDLTAARAKLLLGFADLTATVRDGDTLEPLAGRTIQIVETGRVEKTGPVGEVTMQLSAETLTLRVEGDFYYPPADFPVTIEHGVAQSVTLDIFRAPFGSVTGRVEDETGSGIEDAVIEVPGTPLAPVMTAGDGTFLIEDVPAAPSYLVLAGLVPGYGAAHALLAVEGEAATDWSPTLVDAETFEADDAGYTAFNEWEWGTPSFPGFEPVPTFSGTKVWGIDLDSTYDNVTTSILTSPVFDMSEAEELELSFHHWYWVDSDDGGQVQVWDESQSTWVVVDPVGGYPDESIVVLSGSGGYNGRTDETGYRPAVFDLDEWVGGDFQFRLYFRTTAFGAAGLGWYVDDIALNTGQGQTASVDTWTTQGETLRLLGLEQNPTAGASVLHFELFKESNAEIVYYTVNGSRVASQALGRLTPGTHTVKWDGSTRSGERVGSGVYFFRLHAGPSTAEGKLVRSE